MENLEKLQKLTVGKGYSTPNFYTFPLPTIRSSYPLPPFQKTTPIHIATPAPTPIMPSYPPFRIYIAHPQLSLYHSRQSGSKLIKKSPTPHFHVIAPLVCNHHPPAALPPLVKALPYVELFGTHN